MSSIIRVKNLNYKNILKDINIKIDNNKFIAISGSNKCGKTTLIKLLCRRISINNTIKINNKLIENYNIKDLKDILGTVLYSDNKIFKNQTLKEELESIPTSNKERYKEIINLFKMKKYEKENPNSLPHYMKIKLELAKEIIGGPKILLIDDIFLGLNNKEKKELLKIISYLREQENITVVLFTSQLEEVINCDYIYIMYQGSVVLEGKTMDILEKDNVLNKLGLELPFMIDLSVKLRDYDLIKRVELDMDRMIDTLWN